MLIVTVTDGGPAVAFPLKCTFKAFSLQLSYSELYGVSVVIICVPLIGNNIIPVGSTVLKLISPSLGFASTC